MNNLLRAPIAYHSGTYSNFDAQNNSLLLHVNILCEHLTNSYLGPSLQRFMNYSG